MLDDTAPPSFVPLLRTLTLPADANLNGGIFGGWILSQMDKAAGLLGMRRSAGSCTTVAIENLKFLAPLHSGEEFSIYGEVLSAGRTSLKLRLEGRAADPAGGPERVIIDAFFVVVALDAEGRPRPLSGTAALETKSMQTLIVQMKCKLGEAYDVAAYIVDNVTGCQIYSISGVYDLLAVINLEAGVDPGVFVNKQLHSVPGLVETNTMIAFNAFTPPGEKLTAQISNGRRLAASRWSRPRKSPRIRSGATRSTRAPMLRAATSFPS